MAKKPTYEELEQWVKGLEQSEFERKRAERALIESEAWHKNLLYNLSDAIFETDNSGNVTYANQASELLTGVALKDIVGKSFLPFFDKRNQETAIDVYQRTLHGESPQYELTFKSGRTAQFKNKPLRNKDGDIIGVFGVARDITEHKRAQELLKKNEAKFRFLTENMTDVIWAINTDFRTTYVSPSIKRVLGYTPEERKLQSIEEQVTPSSLKHITERFQEEVLRDKEGADPDRHVVMEAECYHKDGSTVWIEMSVHAIRDEDGEIVQMYGVSRDITERKQAEDALRTSHERFLTVLNSIDATIYVSDMETYEILFANQYMKESFGRDITGKICWEVVSGESGPCPCCTNDQLIDKNGKPTGVCVWQGKNPITEKWYICHDRAIEWTDGRLVRLQIATDISGHKKMEEELHQTRKMEALGTLAGGVAHEFNNILGIILGNAELAIDDVPEWNPAKHSLEEIREASLRAKDVVRQIMSFARKMPATYKPVKISAIIKESLKLMRATIPTNIDIRQEFLCDSEMILSNPTEINQILINLCSNAVHAMEGGVGILDVRLETAILNNLSVNQYEDLMTGEYIKLTVKDNGVGISSEILDRVFDPYFTTKDVDEGLGMGLAVVFGIMKKHNGAIELTSEVGNGTTVEVLFPVVKGRAEAQVEESEDLPSGTERILVVDDETSLVNTVTQMLERQGYKALGFTNSTEAFGLFQKESDKFDLVITDMAMPGMTGDSFAKEIIKIKPNIPIILCTGHSDRIDDVKAKELGIAAYAAKPLEKRRILKMIRKVLDDSSASNQ